MLQQHGSELTFKAKVYYNESGLSRSDNMKFIKKYSKYIFLFICMFLLMNNVSALNNELLGNAIEPNVLSSSTIYNQYTGNTGTTGNIGFKNNIEEKYVICNGTDIPYGIPVIISSLINVVKVLIPVILIVLGMIDFLKATIANDEKAMKDSTSTFVRRLIAAVIIYLIFAVVQFVFAVLADASDGDNAFDCVNCFINKECGQLHDIDEYYYK